MECRFDELDALIMMSIPSTGCTLERMLGNVEYLDHSIPDSERLQRSLRFLIGAGWVSFSTPQFNVFYANEEIEKVFDSAFESAGGDWEGVFAVLQQMKIIVNKICIKDVQFDLVEGEYETATARFNA